VKTTVQIFTKNFIRDVSVNDEQLIKFWQSSASRSGSENFLKGGDSEDGEDDELQCVIGESEGDKRQTHLVESHSPHSLNADSDG